MAVCMAISTMPTATSIALDTEQIIDVRVELPPEVIRQVEAQTGTKITEYRIDFFGTRQSTTETA
jgi:Fe2+ or Zn2+ uptake regulation protein